MPRDGRFLAVFALASAFVAAPSFAQVKRAPDLDQVTGLIAGLVNDFRLHERRDRVRVNARLTDSARYMARHMAETGQFGHGADGSDPAARAWRHGYDYCIVAENIAYRFSSDGFATRELAQAFVEGWKGSPGHRKNMLDPEVTETGVAVVHGARNGYYYAVQMFGRPSSQEINFRITNNSGVTVRYQLGGKILPLASQQTRIHRQCRSEELKLARPGAERDAPVRPANGDRLAIVRSGSGGLSLRME